MNTLYIFFTIQKLSEVMTHSFPLRNKQSSQMNNAKR